MSGLGLGVGCLVLWRERRGKHREGQEDREFVAERGSTERVAKEVAPRGLRPGGQH